MAGSVKWNGNAFVRQMQAQARRNTATACKRLQGLIKVAISQSGSLVYHPMGKRGKALKRTLTIYNFTHSAPGNPPYEQTGHLRRSTTWELVSVGGGATVTGRVGTNLKVGRWLERGTRRMRRRPYIVITLRNHEGEIRSILIGGGAPGGLAAIGAIANRSGILGRGAIGAGF